MHSTTETFSSAALMKIVGTDTEMLTELLEAFRAQSPVVLSDMRTAMASGNARRLSDAAHLMQNVVAMAGGVAGREIARRVESTANLGHVNGAGGLVDLQAADLATLAAAFASFVARTTAMPDGTGLEGQR